MNRSTLVLGIITGVALLALLSLHGSKPSAALDEGRFADFCRAFAKEYHSLAERAYRLSVFRENLRTIEAHNARTDVTWEADVNQFADLTFAEFREQYLADMSGNGNMADHCPEPGTTKASVPDKVDWEAQGKVQRVKNQGMCGSCWAFSAVGALESAYAIKTGQAPPDISEQELVDCSSSYGNKGCGGGLMQWAYDYIIDHNIHSQKEYPYRGIIPGKCKTDKIGKGKFGVAQCLKSGASVEGLVQALTEAPVAVAMLVESSFMFYRKGIYNPSGCKGEPNHGVLAVGYDLKTSPPSFRVKNSWGTFWGQKGYFEIATGTGAGTCSIAGNGNNYYVVAL